MSLLLRATLAFGGALSLWAQSGVIGGRVLDPAGQVVPQAPIQLVNEERGLQLQRQTDGNGAYLFQEVPPGKYRLAVRASGFQPQDVNLVLPLASRLTVDFDLKLLVGAEQIEVSDRVVSVNSDNAQVSTLFTRDFVQNLPLNGRSFQSLLELTPGVVLAPASISNPGQFAVNGQRTNANYFLVDGVSGNVAASASATFSQQAAGSLPAMNMLGGTNGLVSVDALEEFRVTTSTYSAEYGRSPGGQVILQTRGGSNRWTGSLYNYFRNERLDANDWFANANRIERLPLRQNNFGGTLGGPVRIPKLYNGKDRTFFFASYEGLRMKQPLAGVRNLLVPSEAARQRATGPASAVFAAFPLPNSPLLPGDAPDPNLARYVYGVSNPSQFDAFSLRADHRIGQRLQLFTRFNNSPSAVESRVFVNQDNRNEINLRTWTTGLTWTLRPTLVSDLRVNWSGSDGVFNFIGREVDGARLPPAELLFGPNLPRETSSVTLNLIAGAQPLSLSQGRTLGNDQRQWNIVETVSWFRGGHHLKFGFDYRLLLPSVKARSLGVTHAFTTRANSNGVTDLLETGRVNTTIQALAPVSGFRIHNFSAFVQDTWRVTPRLTLDYGLRWEVNPAPSGDLLPYQLDRSNDLLNAQLAPANTPLYPTTWANFAPRAGLAYRLNRAGTFVLRAGAGLFYDLGNGQALQGFTGFPFNSVRTLNGLTWPVPNEQIVPLPFNADPPYSGTFRVMERNLRLPFTRQWNVALERSLGQHQLLTVSYVGADASRLLRTEILRNQTAFGQPVIPVINPALFAPTTTVFLTRNAAASNYHSLQVQFQRRMARGLQAMASYTWAKAIDNMSDEVTGGLPVDGIASFNLELDNEFAPASFDVRQIFTGAMTWQLPAWQASRLTRVLTGGWALDGILRLRTGLPFTVITQVLDPLNFGSNRRVDYLGAPVWINDANVGGGQRLNAAAFRIPAETGRLGNLGRNALRGFPVEQLDFAVRREFQLTEQTRLQFKAELFNALNHANFGLPLAALGPTPNATFGTVNSMLGRSLGGGGTAGGLSPLYQVGGPRSVQLSLRLFF